MTVSMCSLLLAATSFGCGQHSVAQDGSGPGSDTSSDTGADTGADTDSLPDECPTVDLSLSEAHSGHAINAVMLPAAQGGSNHVTSSCGGAGVDQAYLVTSQKTANYDLWVSSKDLQSPLTVHIHAGDSCNGPELYCATGTEHLHSLLLAEGETVTVVVDTEPDLPIPSDGLQYDVAIIWGPEICEAESLQACHDAAGDELEACMANESCADLGAATACHAGFADAMQACFDTFCPSQSLFISDACERACATRRSNCESENGCDPNTCTYQWQMCADTCTCNRAEFEFEFAGDCELVLPGPPLGVHIPYTHVEIDGEFQALADPGLACDDPSGPAVVWASESVMQLCTPACDAFAAAGVATVVYGSPPCE